MERREWERAEADWRESWAEGFTVDAVGEVAVAKKPDYDHVLCRGLGLRPLLIDGVERMARCRCQRLPDRIHLFNRAMIPARHANSRLENFEVIPENKNLFEQSRRWLNEFNPTSREQKGVLLFGDPGCGKTHLVCGMLFELIFRHGVPCRFFEFTHLMGEIREAIEKRSAADFMQRAIEMPVLAIDDLGQGRTTEFEISVIDEIVSKRYNARRVTLFTTNFKPERSKAARPEAPNRNLAHTHILNSLQDRLNPRIYSRLLESVQMVAGGANDYRPIKGARRPEAPPSPYPAR